ncbi:MAG: hypothetical protein LUD07_02210 [Clostridiales bacterium]|nr:hypothetical protein [Clostridiales bacterium]
MMMEKVYHTMKNAGAVNIVIGIILLVTGVTLGVLSIVYGSILLKRKSDLEF